MVDKHTGAIYFVPHTRTHQYPMPYPDTHSITRQLAPLQGASRLRSRVLAITAVASVVLLGGCSIWPKSLSFQSDPAPAQAPAAAPEPAVPAPKPAPPLVPGQDVKVASATPISQSVPAPVPLEPKAETKVPVVAEAAKAEPAPDVKIHKEAMSPTAPSPAPAIAQRGPTSDLVHGFYINVGLFAVPTNGTNAYRKLEKAGLPVFSDELKTKKGLLTRVRVGPFTTRAQADVAVNKIQVLKLDAVVFQR